MNPVMDIHQILKKLPHRYPILLVDRVLEVEEGKRIRTLKNVTINEPFFIGHFPHRPVMPGVLMLEAMAQSAALLSFVPRLDLLHVVSLGPAVCLIAIGYLTTDRASAAAQLYVAMGVLLLMLAPLPTRSTLPPRAWRETEERT